jgi:hypothetical protein
MKSMKFYEEEVVGEINHQIVLIIAIEYHRGHRDHRGGEVK